MIFGAHVIVYSTDATADRAFFDEILGFASVDAGHGWLIFALPPTEAAVHPTEGEARTSSSSCVTIWRPRYGHSRPRASGARTWKRQGGARSPGSGFRAELRSGFTSPSIHRPWSPPQSEPLPPIGTALSAPRLILTQTESLRLRSTEADRWSLGPALFSQHVGLRARSGFRASPGSRHAGTN